VRSPLPALRQRLAAFIAGKPQGAPQRRMYGAARPTRSGGLGNSGSTSADAELSLSLDRLRNASRQVVRDSAYAKRARQIIVNNIIGSGVGMQAQVVTTRGDLAARINSAIEEAFCEWACADHCHTGGALHFHDLERAAMGQVFEAGEAFIRLHFRAFGSSRVPLALELVEAERLATGHVEPGTAAAGNEIRMGVEVDPFGRAVAYWVRQRHPGDIRGAIGASERFERVPADQMFHLRTVDRWPQTRGEPWLHAVVRKLDDLNETSQAELAATRANAYVFATIRSPEGTGSPLETDQEDDGKLVMDMEPLTIQGLRPGEELDLHSPNRPNANLDAFLRHMVREVAAGALVSYESLSRDYSQSNYSSSRLSLLDDRDTYKALQQWWVRSFRRPLHKLWLGQAVLARAIEALPVAQYAAAPAKFEAVLFKPRGWSWIDPTKEVAAYKEAIKAGLTTLTDVIAATGDGRDIEDVVATRRRELDMLDAADIDVDTTVEDPSEVAAAAAPSAAPTAPAEDPAAAEDAQPEDAAPAAGRVLRMPRKATA